MTADVEFGAADDPTTPSPGAPVRAPAMRAYCATLARFTSSVQSTEQLLRNDDAGTREDTEQREQTAATRLRGIHRASSAADDGLAHCAAVRSEYGLTSDPPDDGPGPHPARYGRASHPPDPDPLPSDEGPGPHLDRYARTPLLPGPSPLPSDEGPGPHSDRYGLGPARAGRPAADDPPAGHLPPAAANRPAYEPSTRPAYEPPTRLVGHRSSRTDPDPDYGPPTARRPPADDTLGFGTGTGTGPYVGHPSASHPYASRPAGADHVPLGGTAARRADLSLRGTAVAPGPDSPEPGSAGPRTAGPTEGDTTTAGPTSGAATAVHTDPVVHRTAHQLDDPAPTLDRLRRTGGADLGVALTALGRRRDELKLAEVEFETWLVAHDERSRRVTMGAVVGAGLAGAAVMVVAGTRTSAAMTLALLIVCTLAVVAVGLGVAAARRLPRVCRGAGLARRPDAAALVRYGGRIGGVALLALTAANIAAGAF
ncbi:hypothetical protein [Jiangella muralis]|uniref:hypothetical protein n=1 Tax=Jiangella muralis TaxID=702383 RepID=UPI00069F3926|nr:hypothetical protein [Jiangella muralis]